VRRGIHATHLLFTGQNILAFHRTRGGRARKMVAWPYVEQILLCCSSKYHRENVGFCSKCEQNS